VLSNLKCQALVKCIGYKSMPIEGVAWDNRKHTIPNEHGIVTTAEGKVIPGLYCAGWVKRGPVGIIDSTLRDSVETFRSIKHHIETN